NGPLPDRQSFLHPAESRRTIRARQCADRIRDCHHIPLRGSSRKWCAGLESPVGGLPVWRAGPDPRTVVGCAGGGWVSRTRCATAEDAPTQPTDEQVVGTSKA